MNDICRDRMKQIAQHPVGFEPTSPMLPMPSQTVLVNMKPKVDGKHFSAYGNSFNCLIVKVLWKKLNNKKLRRKQKMDERKIERGKRERQKSLFLTWRVYYISLT